MAVFFWKRTTTAGAVVSIVLGTVVTVAWNVAQSIWGLQKDDLDAVYPALAASVVAWSSSVW